MTTLIMSDEGVSDIMQIAKSLEESGLSIKGVNEEIQHEAIKQKGFLGILLGTLRASLLGNLLTDKSTIRAGQEFQCRLILELILKYKGITKMNLNLMVLTQEIIYLT